MTTGIQENIITCLLKVSKYFVIVFKVNLWSFANYFWKIYIFMFQLFNIIEIPVLDCETWCQVSDFTVSTQNMTCDSRHFTQFTPVHMSAVSFCWTHHHGGDLRPLAQKWKLEFLPPSQPFKVVLTWHTCTRVKYPDLMTWTGSQFLWSAFVDISLAWGW